MNIKPPGWVKHVSEIALLSVRTSVVYWIALLLASYGLATITAWSISLFAPMSSLARLPTECPSATACASPPISLANCGSSPQRDPPTGAAFWWTCPAQRLVVFSVRSTDTDSGFPSAHWIFKSDPRAGGGLFVFPLLVDDRGVSRYGSRIDLITFYSRNILNPATPTIAAPYPVEFLEGEVRRIIEGGEHVNLSDPDEASKAIAEFDAGVRKMALEDRPGFFARRAISGEIQQVTLILFWVFVLIAACRMWLGNHERMLLEKYKDDGLAEAGQVDLLRRVISDSDDRDRSRSDVLAWLCNCAVAWIDKGVSPADVPALIDLERESLGRTWDHEYAPFKFILWAIPSIGFVGTVVGIGQSMMLTAGLASPDESARVGARGAISSSISVAFDTTLVALVAAIALMLVFLALQAKENGALEEARDFVVSRGLSGSSGR